MANGRRGGHLRPIRVLRFVGRLPWLRRKQKHLEKLTCDWSLICCCCCCYLLLLLFVVVVICCCCYLLLFVANVHQCFCFFMSLLVVVFRLCFLFLVMIVFFVFENFLLLFVLLLIFLLLFLLLFILSKIVFSFIEFHLVLQSIIMRLIFFSGFSHVTWTYSSLIVW